MLGPLSVRVDGVEQPIRAGKQRSLLARLVVDFGEVISTDRIIDSLWGPRPPVTVGKNLQVLIGRLRAVVGSKTIATVPGGYRLARQRCSLDAALFEHLVSAAEGHATNGRLDDAIALIDDAMSLWRGDIATELRVAWGHPVVARWAELHGVARERALAYRVSTSPTTADVEAVRDLIRQYPHRESLRALLADALRQRGDVDAARSEVTEGIETLGRDLGLDPATYLAGVAARLAPADDDVPRSEETSAVAHVLTTLGNRFNVDDVLRAMASDGDAARVAALDELEAMLERGELVRRISASGVLTLEHPQAPGEQPS
ncbi:MAG: transcriptional regulator, winged helix family [Thermoleophilia bacterium]|nr:transcriptional regulator, winged helix family [Thermoleophilia bacterium]